MNRTQKIIVAVALFAMALVALLALEAPPDPDRHHDSRVFWSEDGKILWSQLIAAWSVIALVAGGVLTLITPDKKAAPPTS